MKVTKCQRRSCSTASLQTIIRPFGTLISKPGKPFPAGSPQLKIPSSAAKLCTIEERKVEDIWIYDISAKSSSVKPKSVPRDEIRSTKRRVYYIAGGSFCMPPSSDHWKFVTELSQRIPEVHISLLSPPLAPHSPAPLTYPQLMQLYQVLLTQSRETNESVCFAGDSSGANLALSLVLQGLQDFPTVEPPENILLISPVVDLSFTNPSIREVEKYDPVLRLPIEIETGKSWAASWRLDDLRLSPLFANLTNLRTNGVKVHGVVGTNDLLTPDAIRFREMCQEEGVEGEWLEWEKQMHCFPLAWHYHLPESIEGKHWIVDLLDQNM
ncbi:MAG: hypothetical protein Q9191_001788 [Dirinaria sp. TL-2023a]